MERYRPTADEDPLRELKRQITEDDQFDSRLNIVETVLKGLPRESYQPSHPQPPANKIKGQWVDKQLRKYQLVSMPAPGVFKFWYRDPSDTVLEKKCFGCTGVSHKSTNKRCANFPRQSKPRFANEWVHIKDDSVGPIRGIRIIERGGTSTGRYKSGYVLVRFKQQDIVQWMRTMCCG